MITNKILYIGAYPPPFGGIASHLSDLYEVYDMAKTDFFVFDLSKRNVTKSEGHLHINSPKRKIDVISDPTYLIYVFKYILKFIQIAWSLKKFMANKQGGKRFPFTTIAIIIDILKIMEKHQITTISVYHTFPEAIYPYLVKKYFYPQLRYAVTVFGELQANTIALEKYGYFYKKTLEQAEIIMASSNYCGRGVEKLGLSSETVRVIPYGVNIEHFKRTIPYEQTKSDHRILFVGQINERMGLKCLIESISILRKKKINVSATIVGADHGYLSELNSFICSKKLSDSISIHSNISYENLINFYNTAYLYVNTANTKLPCMGLSMKEAMAAELPVIASTAGGIPEAVLVNKTGFIFEVDNAYELSHYIEILINDFELAKNLGQEGRKRAEELFDRDKSSLSIIDVLSSL
jgi:glycosyltransferase involved in cell wall biosynthesis